MEILGSYALLAEIVRGDVTTVHLAQKQGALGFQRLVAIKRLSAVFARQPDFVQLMLDEARLASGLHHANVVGIHDVGTDPSCYIVMDYVEGDSLGTLLSRAGAQRNPRFVAPVLVDMLNGLHAVHTAIDENGAPLYIVHQAPTAHHVLVGIDGTARLTDLSQARSRVTLPSPVRNDRVRVAAMAPEHALHPEHVDHRADLFIVGTVLWEALTGERLFAADTDELTFQNLVHARMPKPSEVGLKPPRCFDHVVMRALERDPERRYQTALEMARDLRDTALNHALYATAGELGQWVTSLVGPELVERRKRAVDDPSLEQADSGTSGFYSSPHQAAKENPYQSGRIYGGSYSHVDRGQDVVTLRPGVRPPATLPSLPSPVSASGKASDSARPSRAPDRQSVTPSGARIASPARGLPPIGARAAGAGLTGLPQGSLAPPAASSTLNVDIPSARAPTLTYEQSIAVGPPAYDAESTNPGGFVPTRPGGRRDARAPSPGAYSEHKPKVLGAAVFDEVDTSRLNPPPSPSSYPPPPLGSTPQVQPQKQQARRSEPDSVRPSVTEKDGRQPSGRQDSTPLKLTLPDGPVGTPHLPPEPLKLEPRPKRKGARHPLGDVMATANSIAPSTQASRSNMPEVPPDFRPRGFGFWIGTGLLTGIIALAAFVGVRNWAVRQAAGHGVPVPAEVAPAAPVVPAPVVAPASEPSPAPAAPPQPEPSAAAPEAQPQALLPATPAPAAAPGAIKQPAQPGAKAKLAPVAAPAKPAAPKLNKWPGKGKKPVLKGKPTAGAAAEPTGAAEAPAAQPAASEAKAAPAPDAAAATPERKPARKANIPDNPY